MIDARRALCPLLRSFTTTDGEVCDPFRGGGITGEMTVTIASGAVLKGDASAEAGSFGLIDGLRVGETQMIEVEGIGTSAPDGIVAHEVRSRVEH